MLHFEQHLCFYCLSELPLTYFWQYQDNCAEQALWGRVRIERVCSLFFFKGRYKEILHHIKYKSGVCLALYMGEMLGEKMASAGFPKIDYIVPVPLHPFKRLKRGYNQSYIISKGILKGLTEGSKKKNNGKGRERTAVLTDIIKRKKFTSTQTKKGKEERWRGVMQAFALKNRYAKNGEKLRAKLNGRHILIVDDVMTTGATIEACCNILSNAGCKISIATIAYVE